MPVQATAHAPLYYPALTYTSLTGLGFLTRTDKEKWRETDCAGIVRARSLTAQRAMRRRCRDLLKIGGDRDLLVVVVLIEIPIKNSRKHRAEKRVRWQVAAVMEVSMAI